MNSIVLLNSFALLFYLSAFFLILYYIRTARIYSGPGILAAAALSTAFFVSASNILEHSGTSDLLDDYEGFARDLFVLFILIFLYVDSMHREQARREKDQKQIQSDLREKALLLTEIHHRVNNNLQIVSGLLALQGETEGERPLSEALRITRNRIQSIAKVHQIIYDSNNLIRIGARAILDSVIRNLQNTYGEEKGEVRVAQNMDPDITLDLDRAMPLGLILNELLTNSFLHAFPKGEPGNILVELKQDEKNIILSVFDSGKGSEESIRKGRKGGIGMSLVETLVQQIRGNIGFDYSKGTFVKISLPKEANS
ncbi:sensor histidine kinase [Leptospira wolffii]|uniref:sensor histidine kinase n=1 Tax=Leptospira wolffii TaxID=409998 RepID=UPI00108449AA|nr:sensor histidine kinase [Leptospira wolffii]TGL50890.1 sensor histidine kinase [Leptospira wolffii]